ncbi:FxSxx-COOH system tetratricopeptide repeat protein [Streptomyces sp. NPDC002276]
MAEDETPRRFFVSHAGADQAWAAWVAWELEAAGHTVELDFWDWGAGDNFILKMNTALAEGQLLALFSTAYFDPRRFTTEEWSAVLAARERLIPLRLDRAEAPPMLRALLAPSLAGLDEEEARRVLLDAVAGPRRPDGKPAFPGPDDTVRTSATTGTAPGFPGLLPQVWNLPARNAGFTGREELLARLRQELAAGSPVAMRALRGRGGVGKTQLAIEYAHRFASDYELGWWISAEETALVPDQLAALAVRTGVADPDTPAGEACEALVAELRTRGHWLLVFDNAEDPTALTPHLPGGAGHVLITSRNPNWHERAVPVDVDGFTRTESIGLLRGRVPHLSEADADDLAEALEDLPLALAQAAALLADGLTVNQYEQLLKERISEVLDEGCPDGYPVSLAAQISLSAERLGRTEPVALSLLHACSLLAPEPFPLHVCRDVPLGQASAVAELLSDPLLARRALGALARQALAHVRNGTVQPHRLTQRVIRDRLTVSERAEAARAAEALLIAAHPGSPTEPATWSRWPDLVPHLLAFDPAELTTPEGRSAACDACWYLLDHGQTRAALSRLEVLHQTWTRQLGPDHLDTLWAVQCLARAHADIQEHARARELNEDALQRMRRVLGDDHPDTLAGASHLASRLAALGEIKAARDLDEDTLARARRVLGEDHRHTLGVSGNLANRLAALGETTEARALYEDVLVRKRRVLGWDDPDTLVTAHGLARVLADLSEVEAALVLDKDTLARRLRVLGEDHPDTLASASNVAHGLGRLGDLESARVLAEETLDRQRQVVGRDDPNTLVTAFVLATVQGLSGQPEAARDLGRDTLDRQRRVLGWDDPDTLFTASNLAVDLSALGDFRAARELDEDTLSRCRRVLGEDDPATLGSAANLAPRLALLGEIEAARTLAEESLPRMRKTLGPEHPDTLRTASLLKDLSGGGSGDTD